jgi:hypothetical protein
MLQATCPEEYWKTASKRFINLHRRILNDRNATGIPWFVPNWAGGLGLYPPRQHKESYLRKKERLGVALIKRYWLSKGMSVNLSSTAEWQMHELVMERFKPYMHQIDYLKGRPLWSGLSSDLEDHYRKVYKYGTIELLFHKKFNDLFHEGGSGEEGKSTNVLDQELRLMRQLRRNASLWRTVMNVSDLETLPVTEEEMISEKKIDNFACLIM